MRGLRLRPVNSNPEGVATASPSLDQAKLPAKATAKSDMFTPSSVTGVTVRSSPLFPLVVYSIDTLRPLASVEVVVVISR